MWALRAGQRQEAVVGKHATLGGKTERSSCKSDRQLQKRRSSSGISRRDWMEEQGWNAIAATGLLAATSRSRQQATRPAPLVPR